MRRDLLLAVALLVTCAPTLAVEVAGVEVLAQVTTAGGDSLTLNGAGIRSKFFIKVYVGALYLPTPTRQAESILQQNAPVAMHLHIVHSEISKEKMVSAWTEGFEDNLSESERASLAPRINRFNGLFRTVREGDTVALSYQPGHGTTVRINDDVRGVIEGRDFRDAWLRIWLGDRPADKSLKRDILDGN